MPLKYPAPPLRSSTVSLRRWAYDDLACVAEASTDPEIPRGTTVPAEYTKARGRKWIQRQWARQATGQGVSMAVVETATQRARGLMYLGLRRPEGHCEIGYWLVPGARGRGLGTEAIMLASRWVLTHTDVYRLYAHVVPDNAPSLKALATCGFSREGVLRSYLEMGDERSDVVSLSLLASDL